jgi:hypothetical protein
MDKNKDLATLIMIVIGVIVLVIAVRVAISMIGLLIAVALITFVVLFVRNMMARR